MKLSSGQIFWRETGVGTTLVFLHGSWNESSQWLPVIEQLSSTYHCLAPDLLGCGESDRPSTPYSIELEVETLAELLETLRLRQVYLVGHSLGAWVASSYALKYMEQVQGLILMHPEGLQIEGGGNRWFWPKLLLGKPPFLLWGLRSLYPLARVFGQHHRIQRAIQTRQQLRQFPTACQLLFQRRWAAIKAEFLQERLNWLKLPVLLLQTADETDVSLRLTQTYARLATNAYLRQIPYTGKDSLQEAPEQVAEAIRAFIEEG